MTSKEALKNIKNILREDENVWEYNEDIKQIEKDLEVLEIVKTHKLLNYVIKNEKCAKMYNLTEKEIIKIKEWLENDNN